MPNVVLVSYDPNWEAQFQAVAHDLSSLACFKGAHIQHIGSTSIPGMDAKDVIDVQVIIDNLSTVPNDDPGLMDLGYVCKPGLTDHVPAGSSDDASLWTKQFWARADPLPRVNLHIRQVDHPNWRFALLFRDYLRANPRMAASYVAAKRALATSLDAADYPVVKDPIIDTIMVAAEAWATESNWHASLGNN